MRIGIDIDGVLLDSENEIRVAAELYDLIELKKQGVKHPEGFLEVERYEWEMKELEKFRNRLVDVELDANPKPGAKRVTNLLKADGHTLVIISARGIIGPTVEQTKKQLQENGFPIDEYYFQVEDKANVCKQAGIDVMIEDRAKHCEKIAKQQITALYFRDVNRKKLEENPYLKEVNTWGEVYRQICKMEGKTFG